MLKVEYIGGLILFALIATAGLWLGYRKWENIGIFAPKPSFERYLGMEYEEVVDGLNESGSQFSQYVAIEEGESRKYLLMTDEGIGFRFSYDGQMLAAAKHGKIFWRCAVSDRK